MRWGIIAASALLAGCASSTWYHPGYVSETRAERMFTIDNGRCQQVAHGAAPMPVIPVSSSGRRTTYVEGSGYDAHGRRVGSFSGTAYSYSQGNAATGFANGLNVGNAVAAGNARGNIYRGCMTRLGWTTNKQAARRRSSNLDAMTPIKDARPGSIGAYVRDNAQSTE